MPFLRFIWFVKACVVVLILASGCGNTRPLQESVTVKDTTWSEVNYTYRDTVIYTDTAYVETVIDCDSLFNTQLITPIKLKRKQANLTLKPLPNGKLRIRCDCDSAAVKARLRDKLTREFNRRETEIRITESDKAKPLKWAIAILAVILGLVIIKELKSLFKS